LLWPKLDRFTGDWLELKCTMAIEVQIVLKSYTTNTYKPHGNYSHITQQLSMVPSMGMALWTQPVVSACPSLISLIRWCQVVHNFNSKLKLLDNVLNLLNLMQSACRITSMHFPCYKLKINKQCGHRVQQTRYAPTCLQPTFDCLTFKLVCESLMWGTFIPNLGTLGLWVLELFAMYTTDWETDGRIDKSNAYCPLLYDRGHNKDLNTRLTISPPDVAASIHLLA